MKNLTELKLSKELEWHISNGIGLSECVYRYGSDKYCLLIKEARELHNSGKLLLEGRDKAIASLKTGEPAIYDGKKVKLHLPKYDNTAGKKLSVYLESGKTDPETGLPLAKILRFGDPNSTIKNHDKKAADNFQARHSCDTKDDINTAGFWSCNIHLFAKHLGLESDYPW
jgi:hypothetical protein